VVKDIVSTTKKFKLLGFTHKSVKHTSLVSFGHWNDLFVYQHRSSLDDIIYYMASAQN